MSKTHIVPVNFDFDGNAWIQIPEDICFELNLNDNDKMSWEIIDNKLIMRKHDER